MDFQAYLNQYDQSDSMTNEKKRDLSSEPIIDGRYLVNIVQMKVTRSKTKGLPQLLWMLEITEGTYKGRTLWKIHGLDTFEKIGYLKKDLALAGLHLHMMADLEKEMNQLIDQPLEVIVKNNGKWQNVYIQKQSNSSSLYQSKVAYPF